MLTLSRSAFSCGAFFRDFFLGFIFLKGFPGVLFSIYHVELSIETVPSVIIAMISLANQSAVF